jgi:hypothetical protein
LCQGSWIPYYPLILLVIFSVNTEEKLGTNNKNLPICQAIFVQHAIATDSNQSTIKGIILLLQLVMVFEQPLIIAMNRENKNLTIRQACK